MFKKIATLCFILFACLFLLALYVLYFPVVTENDFHFIIMPGTTARLLVKRLNQRDAKINPFVFRLTARILKADHFLQAGEYKFTPEDTIYSILYKVKNGKVNQHAFSIIDGFTFQKILSQAHKDKYIKNTLMNKANEEIAKLLKIKHKSPEGLLLPETYFYTYGTTDLEVFQRAHNEMLNYLKQVWPGREKNLPYKTQYQALIVASMIEKETAVKKEMPIIADVIRKRLQKWMLLQIDPTVIYGLGDKFDGKLSPDELKIDTPYNTYKHYGLPPTPISMPGKAAIYAALHPEKNDYYYFVAKGDGTHAFSATLKEHRDNIDG